MKDLPRVFANKIDDNINKSQNLFYGSDRYPEKNDNTNVENKINSIFTDKHHVYKSMVRITTRDGIIEKEIVGKTNNSLITFKGELIKINDILDIEKI